MTATRRTVLTCVAAACGTGLLAACGNASPRPAEGAAAAPAGTALVALADIEVGGVAEVDGPDGRSLLVARPTADTARAFSAVCPHEGCTVSPQGDELGCPCHGSRFAPLTGERLGGPAPSGLAPVAVTVVDGQVVTA